MDFFKIPYGNWADGSTAGVKQGFQLIFLSDQIRNLLSSETEKGAFINKQTNLDQASITSMLYDLYRLGHKYGCLSVKNILR